jgi:hypothetical protein
MSAIPDAAARHLRGPLLAEARRWPLSFGAVLCDLRPRFLPKCRVGRGYRAVARNGRVLLASDLPLDELTGRAARVRLQTWHRAILAGDTPEPYGLLVCVRCLGEGEEPPRYGTRLVQIPEEPFDLALDVGGGLVLEIRRI